MKKLQIFISSTFEDLREERQLVMEAILEMGHLPAGMEYFVSDNSEQFEIIKRWILESDVYILIVGGRYGSICKKDSRNYSYTHLEYEYACSLNKEIKIILLKNNYLLEKKKAGVYKASDLKNEQLKKFRDNLPHCNVVEKITDIKSVAKTLIGSLTHLELDKNFGWIKSSDISKIMDLHTVDIDLAKKKKIEGKYHMYYYSKNHNRFVYSTLDLSIENNMLVSKLKNDIIKTKAQYTYEGIFEIDENYLHVELNSLTDSEKVFAIIQLLPGKLEQSMGILYAQSTSGQAAATSFIISKSKISKDVVLKNFKDNQKQQFDNLEMLMIDKKTIQKIKNDMKNN